LRIATIIYRICPLFATRHLACVFGEGWSIEVAVGE